LSPASARGWRRIRWGAAGLCAFIGLAGIGHSLPHQITGILRSLGIAAVGLVLGNLTGRLLGLQRRLDVWGKSFSHGPSGSVSDGPGFTGARSAGVLLALNPLLIPAAIQDGLAQRWWGLALKSALDAAALYAWARSLSPRSWNLSLLMLAPPLCWQAVWTAGAAALAGTLHSRGLIDPLMMASSLLILCCTPAIAGVRRAALADLLPTLLWIPFLESSLRS
jgi:uncharacterized membrane protein YqgA involved in biofilm formation